MKVLFTGMASSHCKPSKNVGFYNTLATAMSEIAEVVWSTPSVKWTEKDLKDYDLVFVGITPPTALSANKVYGGLHLLDLIWDSPKVRLVLDFPQLWQYKNSVSKAANDPEGGLFSAFYSSRYEYPSAVTSKSVKNAAKRLLTKEWPATIYPSLPWQTEEDIKERLKMPNVNNLMGLNLDSFLLTGQKESDYKENRWSINDKKLSWSKIVLKTIKFSAREVKAARGYNDERAKTDIETSLGYMHAPQDRKSGVSWSYRLAQAMNARTPIATDWKETINFSSSWSFLPYQIEDMTPTERGALSYRQYVDYVSVIPNRATVLEIIKDKVITSTQGENKNA